MSEELRTYLITVLGDSVSAV